MRKGENSQELIVNLRDYFAGQVMNALIARSSENCRFTSEIGLPALVKDSYIIANAMLKEGMKNV